MNLPQLAQDKANHYLYGSVLGHIAKRVAQACNVPEARFVALGTVTVIAAAKEGWDAYRNKKATGTWLGSPRNKPHGVEFNDWLATVAGAAVVIFSEP